MNEKMDKVEIPKGLSVRQVEIAKAWVDFERNVGGTVEEFIKANKPFSSSTFYKWREDYQFNYYIRNLMGEVITSDERQAYQAVKTRIIEMATSPNANIREIELFTEHFKYVVDAEKLEAMDKLNIVPEGKEITDNRTLEERKNALFAKLKR